MVHRDDLSVGWGGEDEAGEYGQEELSQVGHHVGGTYFGRFDSSMESQMNEKE
jgi:hypothetical protein